MTKVKKAIKKVLGWQNEIVIQHTNDWFRFDWQNLYYYRDLLFLLVRRDFIAKYKQTILGPAWFVIQPVLTTVVFTVIFGKVAKIPTDGIPPMLFYLCGLLSWDYFSKCLSAVATSLTGNAALFSKVYFPRLIVPVSIVISNLLTFALNLIMFLGFFIYFKFFTAAGNMIDPTRGLLVLPFLLLQTAAIGLGVGLWIAALTVRYRDFQHLVGFFVQLWMYATPVIYPMSAIPKAWKWITVANPMSAIVEAYRYAFFGVGAIHNLDIAFSALITALVLISGLLVFNKIERTFVDTL